MTFEYLGVALCQRCRVYRGAWLASNRKRTLCQPCITVWAQRGLVAGAPLAGERWLPRRVMLALDEGDGDTSNRLRSERA